MNSVASNDQTSCQLPHHRDRAAERRRGPERRRDEHDLQMAAHQSDVSLRPVTASERRPHLLVFNQYYRPGVEATAHLLTELCEALADAYDVTVITGRLLGHEHDPDYERVDGIELIRVHSTAFDRSGLPQRAVNYFTYLGRALRRGLVSDRPDLVLCMTDPPMVGDVALLVARRFRVPLVVVSQDVFPEIAVELKRLRNPLLVGLLGVLTRFYLRRADASSRSARRCETGSRRRAYRPSACA